MKVKKAFFVTLVPRPEKDSAAFDVAAFIEELFHWKDATVKFAVK